MPSTETLDLLPDSALQRRTMVDCQIRTFDVTDQAVIARFLDVPREIFVPKDLIDLAYSDMTLPLRGTSAREARVLLPPLVLARMLQAAFVTRNDVVLDVAGATGYSAALLGGLCARVVALESDSALSEQAAACLAAAGGAGVETRCGPLADGASDCGPFDLIFVNGAVEAHLEKLFAQLKTGGRLIAMKRLARDAGGQAGKAVRFDKIGPEICARQLFDAGAPLLESFRSVPQFAF